MIRSASVQTFNPSDRSFDVVWTTGATVRRRDSYGDAYDEELVVTPEAVDLSRLNSGAPLLAQHDSSSLAGVIGNVVRANIANGIGTATVRLSRRQELDGVATDVADGILKSISVGYRIDSAERIQRAVAACHTMDSHGVELGGYWRGPARLCSRRRTTVRSDGGRMTELLAFYIFCAAAGWMMARIIVTRVELRQRLR